MLTNAKQDRGNGDVQLIDQASLEVLADRVDAAAEPNILPIGGGPRLLQGGMDALGDKVKGGAALHRDWRPRVIGQHEDGDMVRRILSPPAGPTFVRPGAADRTEHVAAHNPRAKIGRSAQHKIIVDATFAFITPLHLIE